MLPTSDDATDPDRTYMATSISATKLVRRSSAE